MSGGMSADSMEVVGFLSIRPLLEPDGKRMVEVGGEDTVGTIIAGLGISPDLLGLMLLNGCGAKEETAVAPGDRLALFPTYVPYHKIYGTCVV
jgi:hypothetical protein